METSRRNDAGAAIKNRPAVSGEEWLRIAAEKLWSNVVRRYFEAFAGRLW
jgi:hypothetical protein